VHTVVTATGLPKTTAYRVLMSLCDKGNWIKLARRGDRTRSNLYTLAAVDIYLGLTAYVPPPTYVPPTYVPPAGPTITATLSVTGADPDEVRQALAALLGLPPEQVTVATGDATVLPFKPRQR
jgi:hypothetical protein